MLIPSRPMSDILILLVHFSLGCSPVSHLMNHSSTFMAGAGGGGRVWMGMSYLGCFRLYVRKRVGRVEAMLVCVGRTFGLRGPIKGLDARSVSSWRRKGLVYSLVSGVMTSYE